MSIEIIKPPSPLPSRKEFNRILFLAGSIEMGKAEDWQKTITDALVESKPDLGLCILNPRRDDWNPEWKQSIDNPEFKAQVEWELGGLEIATHIIMYLSPDTISPISLLELGLYAVPNGKMVVICPDGFHRKGNVEIVCKRYGVLLQHSLQKAIDIIKGIK